MSCGVCGKARAAGAEALKWASQGFPIADFQKRLSSCRACEHFSGRICKACGCLIFVKARMETAACPLGKW